MASQLNDGRAREAWQENLSATFISQIALHYLLMRKIPQRQMWPYSIKESPFPNLNTHLSFELSLEGNIQRGYVSIIKLLQRNLEQIFPKNPQIPQIHLQIPCPSEKQFPNLTVHLSFQVSQKGKRKSEAISHKSSAPYPPNIKIPPKNPKNLKIHICHLRRARRAIARVGFTPWEETVRGGNKFVCNTPS